MFFQVTAPPDAKLAAAAIRRSLRQILLTARFVGVLAVLVAVLLHGGTALLVTGALVAVALPVLTVATATRRLLGVTATTTYEITDGGVASSSTDSRHSYAWRAFTHVDQLPGQLLFGKARMRFVPVPTSGLSPAQIEQVLGAAAVHGLRIHRAVA